MEEQGPTGLLMGTIGGEEVKIYIASYFNTKARLLPIRDQLNAMGYHVISTWLDEPTTNNTHPFLPPSEADSVRYAIRDYQEIQDCDLLICDTFDETLRGGREVELGYALGKMKQVYVVGPRRNVFHFTVRHFDTWEACIEFLKDFLRD